MKKQVSPSPTMTSRSRKASKEDRQTISFRRSQDNADELLLKFPIELVMEIFARMTLKSIARCRCVSKRWASILRHPDFTELFFTKFSELVSVVCNPSTKQSFSLPKVKTKEMTRMISYLGYDPIEKQHKVVALIMVNISVVEHQVLTLRGKGNLTWRLIECSIPHSDPGTNSICIHGVLYYTAEAFSGDDIVVVCFDVRSEKYSFVNFMEREILPPTLMNFQGKLALARSRPQHRMSKSFEMWILEDPEKQEWSKRVFSLPPMWKDVVANDFLHLVGVTAENEFVFSPIFPSDPFHVYYYNFVKETITRVQVQGMGAFERRRSLVHIFLNHVADVKLM